MVKRPSRGSQCGRILAVLERGGWHSTRELLYEVPSITHSRIAELRRAYGCEIEHRTTGVGAAGSEYRLVGLLGSGDDVTRAASSPDPSCPASPTVGASRAGQLDLFTVAA